MIFDSNTDTEELDKLFSKSQPVTQNHLLAEIQEEEKICEIEAKADEQKQAANGQLDDIDEDEALVPLEAPDGEPAMTRDTD